ncbi:MAG TPA: YceI family protein [Baekduia sp.]
MPAGRYVLGPDSGTLTVKTGKAGAAAKAGHNLVIDVTAWEATLDLGDAPALTLTADGGSLRVRDGHGGMQALGADDKAGIQQTVDEEILKGAPITFRSTAVAPGPDGALAVEGELELLGRRHPLAFALALGPDGTLTGGAVVKQSDWGIKPYTTLFGTLKVVDEVEVVVEARLPVAR